ncbi:2,3-diaminopropionate biosynthesis protein SbnA [Zhengella mangrovi]|uniref:2,3-diaminopropionate biosynthesis protein SbnA n=1 Tax=Zhengella mangrovi TaxID=1982044 RepID=A0A2G1QGT4_9HYPH|nr:2,3-diaminopropionate biosynthesis protein SbnA [Zhengella mangrovi]PHP64722.1 2,3-diaminopropionate biosynthesis protein SbnA [Zhengella mangrovi]
MIVNSPIELVFTNLFYRLKDFLDEQDVYLKLEGFNVTGSIKIKTAIGLIEDLEKEGAIEPGRSNIVESSSGNLGIALSLVCAAKGYKFTCVTDPNANQANIRGMQLYGANVVVVDKIDAHGGYLETRLRMIDNMLKSDPNAVWLNQYANLSNMRAHMNKTAMEIAEEFEKVDWVFVGSGTTGTLCGVSRRLHEIYPDVKIIAVEPEGSITFGGVAGKRNIPGIGTSVRPPLADYAEPDDIVYVNERQTVNSCLAFARDYHLLVGGSTGSVLAAIKNYAGSFAPGDKIVAISPDLGDKYLDTIYNAEWTERVFKPRIVAEA